VVLFEIPTALLMVGLLVLIEGERASGRYRAQELAQTTSPAAVAS